jgi:hypothetical protein
MADVTIALAKNPRMQAVQAGWAALFTASKAPKGSDPLQTAASQGV